MNKIFTIIKGWILLQMSNVKNWWLSLFSKNKSEELEEETPNLIESTDMQLNLQEETIEQPTLITDDEFVDDQSEEVQFVNESLDPTHIVDKSSSTLTTNPQQQLNESPEPIIQVDIPLLYDGKYDQYFNTPSIPVPMSYVNEEIWNNIANQLPEDYVIPSNSSQSLYQNN